MPLGIGISIPAMSEAAGFAPSDLSGLVHWYRSDLGITLNGSTVSAWANQGSAGGSLSQGTAANQPLYQASDSDFLGKPSLQFDDVNDQLTSSLASSSWAFLSSTAFTLALVGRFTAGGFILSTQDAGLANGWEMNWNFSAGNAIFQNVHDGTAQWYQTQGALASGQSASIIQRADATPNPDIHINGTAGTPTVGAGGAEASPAATLSMGNNAAGVPVGGEITELIVYNSRKTNAEVALLEGYLRSRYGLP